MNNEDLDLSKAPLLAHLLELRSRLLYCLAFFVVVFILSYVFAEHIYGFLQQPLVEVFGSESDRRMIYTGLQEVFVTYLTLAFFAALFFTLPLALMQVWRFIAPGLYRREQRAFLPLFFMTPVLFVLGAALAFYGVMPLAWEFFASFQQTAMSAPISVELEARVSEYLSLSLKLIIAFGLSFELPILLLVLAKAGLVSEAGLKAHRRHAIVAVFLFAGLITPPDIISQIALGLPLLALYELSILLIRWTGANSEAMVGQSPS